MKVTVIPTLINAFGTVMKEIIKGLEDLEKRGSIVTIQTTALLRPARILRRVLETWRDSDSCEKPSAKVWCEKLENWWL